MTSEQKHTNWLQHVTTVLFVIGLMCVLYVVISNFMKKSELAKSGNLDCVKATVLYTVSDEFMKGLYEKDTQVKALENYYNCNLPQKGDIVMYRFTEQIPPVVRFVRGVPGDRYKLTIINKKKGLWSIKVNDEEVKTESGPYLIESNSVPPLKTYEISRRGVLLKDEYLLFGNVSPSISDSSNLGLISAKFLVGKVTNTK